MICGIGCDIIEIERVRKAVMSKSFCVRVFTEAEREYCSSRNKVSAQSYAACFAAKEAVSKALGSGISGFGMTDIEVLHNESGAPYICLHNGAAELAGGAAVHISLSHCEKYATAYAVIDKN